MLGPSTADITREDIFNKPHVFGGACDLYEQIRLEKSDVKAADPETVCPNGRGSFSAKPLGTANLLRVAHITSVCRKLVADNLIKKVGTQTVRSLVQMTRMQKLYLKV